jgi:sulfoxide reductase catalytic subunit YedY
MTAQNVPESEVTPPSVYFNRRTFIRGAAAVASVAATGLIYRKLNPRPQNVVETATIAGLDAKPAYAVPKIGDPETSMADIESYNNFYEFTTDKDKVATLARGFKTDGWKVEVGGLCRKPVTLDMDGIGKVSRPEQRIYRMRCVERWSMIIPWVGYSLSKLLDRVEPLSSAKYVAFQTLLDKSRFPGQNGDVLPWPYVEGLRMDEAMHPLTLLASGIYGRELPPQDGAPVRLVVPWKYGYKGIKSIVKITLVAEQPPCTWNIANPPAYGFYSNVNPSVARPWPQERERRIGGPQDIATLLFNGYTDQVGSLYRGMDLAKDY